MSFASCQAALKTLLTTSSYVTSGDYVTLGDYGVLAKGLAANKAAVIIWPRGSENLGGGPAFTTRWQIVVEVFTKFLGKQDEAVASHKNAVGDLVGIIKKAPNLSGEAGVVESDGNVEGEMAEIYIGDTVNPNTVPVFLMTRIAVDVDQVATVASL